KLSRLPLCHSTSASCGGAGTFPCSPGAGPAMWLAGHIQAVLASQKGSTMFTRVTVLAACCAALPLMSTPAGQPAKSTVVRELDLKGLTQQRTGQVEKPTVIASEGELAKAFPEKAVRERLLQEVDFRTQQLLFFAWSGSGQDKLTAEVKYCPKD